MKDIGTTIAKILQADPAVSALVGTRIYSDMLPQGAEMPAVVYWLVTDTNNQAIDDPEYSFNGHEVQIDSVGRTAGERFQVYWAVRRALIAARRTTVNGVALREVSRAGGQRDTVVRPRAGDDQYRYIASQDYQFYFCS